MSAASSKPAASVSSTTGSGEDLAPLAGLRVLEFGQYIAIPAAGQVLRDLGAEVIKVEPATGDPARRSGWSHDDFGPMFAPYNRGKRSVVLDLSSDGGKDLAVELALSADVVLQNARPGAMARAGLSAPQLRAKRPRLIVAAVTGYGADSDFADRSGLDVATASMSYPWAEYGLHKRMPVRSGNGQPTAAPAADVVATADGAVVISAYVDAHFCRLAESVGRPELASDPRFATNAARVANRGPMLAALGEAFSSYRTGDLCEQLGKVGVVIAAVRNFDQVRTGVNGLSSDLFVSVATPVNQSLEIPASPFHLSGRPALPLSLPGIGEHTAEVLAELASRRASALTAT